MQQVLERVGAWLLLATCLIALVSFPYGAQKHNYAPVYLAFILQFGFVFLFLLAAKSSAVGWAVISAVLALLLTYSVHAVDDALFHFYDFLMGLTPLIYLMLGSLGYSRTVSKGKFNWLAIFIVLLYFLFYSLRLLQGIEEPGFLLENNLELILLSAAAWRLYIAKLSDSRFLIKCVLFFSLAALFFLIDVKGYLLALVTVLSIRRNFRVFSILVGLLLLYDFGGPVYDLWVATDRYLFLGAFVQSFSLLPQIGFELPPDVCSQLEPLLPRMIERFGYCSGALFHGSVPRIFYDYGVLGGVILFYFIYRLFADMDKRYGVYIFVYFLVAGIFISTFGSLLFLCGFFVLRVGLYDTTNNSQQSGGSS